MNRVASRCLGQTRGERVRGASVRGHVRGWPRTVLAACCITLTFCVSAVWAQPQIGAMPIRGLRIAGQTQLVFQGSGFTAGTRLVLPVPIASQQAQASDDGQRLELVVELGEELPAGIVSGWLANEAGVSDAVLLSLGRFPEQAIGASVDALPVALNGVVRGNQVQRIELQLAEGDRLVADLEARRLGGALRPVMRLYNDQGRQIASANPDQDLQGDCRLVHEVDVTGVYQLEIQDMLLRGANPGYFHLKLGNLVGLKSALPLGATLSEGDFKPMRVLAEGQDVTGVVIGSPRVAGWYPLAIQGDAPLSGLTPTVYLSSGTEVSEGSAEVIAAETLPVGISGVLSVPGEHDRLQLQVTPGAKLRVELWANRLGSPLDGVLIVRVPGGAELGRGDDQSSRRDPAIEVTVPADKNQIEVEVYDLLKRGGEHAIYRVSVSDASIRLPSFQVATRAVTVPRDAGTLITVPIQRNGFTGPIQLGLSESVSGVEVHGGYVPPNSDQALIRLVAGDGAEARVNQLIATFPETGLSSVLAEVTGAELPGFQPWSKHDLIVAPTQPNGLEVAAESLSDATVLWQGGITRVPLALTRADQATGPVRIRLATTQQMPRKKIKQENKEVEVDAVERAIRMDEMLTIPADASSGELLMAIPKGMAEVPWGLAVVAERLSDDSQKVLSTSVTPISYPSVKAAMNVKLTGERMIQVAKGEAATGTFTGTLERLNGFTGEAIVTLDGFPEGTMVPEAVIAADANEFKLEVALPAEAKPEDFQSVRLLVRAWDADGYLRAESNEVKVAIVFMDPEEMPKEEASEGDESAEGKD